MDLLKGPIDKTLRQFAAPLALSFLVNILYSWVDLYYVSMLGESGSEASTIAMAALGISERIWFFAFSIASGFALGSSVIIARRIGEKNTDEASYTAIQALIIMINFSVIIVVSLYLLLPLILSKLGISPEVNSYAQVYFSGLALGIPFNFLVFQINAILRGVGNSIYPMYILIIATVLNAIITPILMFGIGNFEGLGFYGSGLGTSVAQLLGFLIGMYVLFGKYSPIQLKLNGLKLNWGLFWRIVKIGFPASLQLIIVSINSMAIAALANLFGTKVLTTYIFALRVDLFIMMSIFAVGASIEVITGQNLGAGNISRIIQFHKSAIKQLSFILFILALGVFIFGDRFAYIFTSDVEIAIELGEFFKISAWYYIPFAVGIISIRVISGAGDYLRSFYITLIGLVLVQLSTSYLLSQFLDDPIGIWYGLAIGMFVFMAISLWQYRKKTWITKKV